MPIRVLYCWNSRLSRYAKLGMVRPTRKLFGKMPDRQDAVLWNRVVIAQEQWLDQLTHTSLNSLGTIPQSTMGVI